MTNKGHIHVVGTTGKEDAPIRPTRGSNYARQIGSWKDVLTKVIAACGGYERTAAFLGKSTGTLSDWTNESKNSYPHIRDVADMVRESGCTVPAEYFAALSGKCHVVPDDGSNATPNELLALANQDFAAANANFLRRMEDGELCGDDLESLLKDAAKLREAAGRFEAGIRAKLPGVA